MTSTSAHQTPYQRTNGAAIEGILTLPSEDSCLCDLLFRFRKIPEWEDCMDGRLNLLPHQVYPLFQDRILSKIIREGMMLNFLWAWSGSVSIYIYIFLNLFIYLLKRMTNQSKDVCVIQRSHARDMEGLKRPAGAEALIVHRN